MVSLSVGISPCLHGSLFWRVRPGNSTGLWLGVSPVTLLSPRCPQSLVRSLDVASVLFGLNSKIIQQRRGIVGIWGRPANFPHWSNILEVYLAAADGDAADV